MDSFNFSTDFGFEDEILNTEGEEVNLEDLVSDPTNANLKAAIEDPKSVEAFVNNPKGEEEILESFQNSF